MNGMTSPAVRSCHALKGDYQIVTAPDGSQSGVCRYLIGSPCTDLQFYKGGGCWQEQLVGWIPLLMVAVVVIGIVLLVMKIRKIIKTAIRSH